MKQKSGLYIEIFCHLLFWFLPTYLSIKYDLVTLGQRLSNEYAYMPFISNVIFNMVLVYSNIFYFFPVYYRRNKLSRGQYASLMIIILLISGPIKTEINNFYSWIYFSEKFSKIPSHEILITEYVIAAFFIVQSILYCSIKEWFREKILQTRLQEEKLTLELKYLKAQINPHFLFNTLNNLYSIALRNKDNETAQGLTKLSGIMRYMLDEMNEKEIILEREIDYLKSYVDLQRLRFAESDDIEISFDVNRSGTDFRIPPFLFIGFVENAFKYGINIMKPSFINIRFDVSDNICRFSIRNSMHARNNVQNHGVGLRNIRDRLELLYGNNHKLDISETNNVFNVDLEIRKLIK